MYKDLVRRLRKMSMDFGELDDASVLLLEAANAIEELSKKYLASEIDNTNLTGWLAEEHAKHLWIPVTERLPIFDEVVQITDGINVGHGYLEGVRSTSGIAYMWQSPFCDIDEDRITHWAPLPEPPEEDE